MMIGDVPASAFTNGISTIVNALAKSGKIPQESRYAAQAIKAAPQFADLLSGNGSVGSGTGLALSALLPFLAQQGTGGQAAASVLGYLSPVITSGAQAAHTAATTGAGFGQSLGAGLGGAGFNLAWNAPAFINTLDQILQGPGQEIRRFKRTRDAGILGGPAFQALTADKPDLNVPIGGVRSGDIAAEILRNVQSGTWGRDTAHGWHPNPEYSSMLSSLNERGYGGREPTLNDVGGVGEIVAGFGPRLGGFYHHPLADQFLGRGAVSDEGGQHTGGSLWEGASNATQGSLAWDAVMRDMIKNMTGRAPTTGITVMPPDSAITGRGGQNLADISTQLDESMLPIIDRRLEEIENMNKNMF